MILASEETMQTMPVTTTVKQPARSGVERMKDYVLNAQNPGKRRNFTVRDSQAIETTLFQRSGVVAVLAPTSSNRMAGYGAAGT